MLARVPVKHFNFRPKCIYVAHMIRRILLIMAGEDARPLKPWMPRQTRSAAPSSILITCERWATCMAGTLA